MKELWIAAYEDLVNDYLDAGFSQAEAEKRAEDEAYETARERILGQADYLRKAAKEGY